MTQSYYAASTEGWYEGLISGQIGGGYYLESPITRQYDKVRCSYCHQRQSILNDDCQFCGAPLPDDAT